MPRPVIETLATGDEVVNGDIVDGNAAYASRQLAGRGLLVTRHTALPDDTVALEAGIREIGARASLCVVSGGLGPTEDDLTPDVVARILGVPLEVDAEALGRMEERFARAGYRLSSNNLRSVSVPAGTEVLQNEAGTAPGFTATIGGCLFFFLPGVPTEYRFFVDAHLLPRVGRLWPGGFGAVVQLKTLGWGESHLAERFEDFPRLFPHVRVGYRAKAPEVWLKLTCEAASRSEALALLEPAVTEAERRLGPSIFGRDEQELDGIVHGLLRDRAATLAVAESCTGGLISSLLTRHPGASDVFIGGVVAYSNSLKERLLGVPPGVLGRHGAVSPETAEAMAAGAANRTGAQFALSVTGIAGPTGATPGKPVGLVYLGLAYRTPGGAILVRTLERRFRGGRERVQRASALTALEMLRRHLLGLPELEPAP